MAPVLHAAEGLGWLTDLILAECYRIGCVIVALPKLLPAAIYASEACLKILAYGLRPYWASGWNKLDCFKTLGSVVDVVLGFLPMVDWKVQGLQGSFFSILRVLNIAELLRLARLFRLTELAKNIQVREHEIQCFGCITCLGLLVCCRCGVLGCATSCKGSRHGADHSSILP